MSIAENVAAIRARMNEAARKAGRDPRDVKLLAATKMNDADAVRAAIAAGVDVCGENRVQELTKKLSENAYAGAPVHFIGHLQTNKVKQVVGKVSLIQSVDSLRLLAAVNAEAARQGIVQDILLEINVAKEESKTGFTMEEIPSVLDNLSNFTNIAGKGFLIIPPICSKSGENTKYFQKIMDLCVDIRCKKYDNMQVECVSMGMSEDFEDAIACGSTMVRVGTAIFGHRNYT